MEGEKKQKPDFSDFKKKFRQREDFGVVYREKEECSTYLKVPALQDLPRSPSRFQKSRMALKSGFSKTVKKASLSLLKLGRSASLITSAVLIMVLSLALVRVKGAKSEVDSLTESAKTHLQQTFDRIEAGDIAPALKEAELAKKDVGRLKLLAQSWGQDIKYLSLVPESRSSLVAYEELLESAYTVLNSFSEIGKGFEESLGRSRAVHAAGKDDFYSTDLLALKNSMLEATGKVEFSLKKSQIGLSKNGDSLPEDLRVESARATEAVGKALNALLSAQTLFKTALPWLSGEGGKNRRILILFQNNTELRGSGGFIGSFASAQFEDGKLKNIDFETNINKIDKAFAKKSKVPPPEELAFLSPDPWTMKNSNFAVDFTESAEKVKEFYNLETGNNADGVIALDATFFRNLLEITGPIDLPLYGKTITAENFLKEVQYEVEVAYFDRPGGKEENEPKKILADMMPLFLEKLSLSVRDREKLPLVMGVLGRALREKHLLFNSNDRELQDLLLDLNYAGSVPHKITDYLFVTNSNIGGAKSSLNVGEKVWQRVTIEPDGRIVGTLELSRTHSGSYNWPDNINRNLVRILLPEDSKIKSFTPLAGNFWPFNEEKNKKERPYDIGKEAGKTKVSFWQNTKPGETSRSILSYESNYRADTSSNGFYYRLDVQKQPGTFGDDFELEINYPAGFRPTNVKNYDPINRRILIKEEVKEDKEYSIRFEKS